MQQLAITTLGAMIAVLCLGCSGAGQSVRLDRPQLASSEDGAPGPGSGWPVALPVDTLQPGERLSAEGYAVGQDVLRHAKIINDESQFTPGRYRFDGGGLAADNGEATSIAGFDGSVSYAVYRLPLGGDEPGVVTVDANSSSPAGYYVGLADYSDQQWEWLGPFRDNHLRLCCAGPASAGVDYTSPLGSLFVCVVAAPQSLVDVVGIGVNPRDPGDSTPPPAPGAPELEEFAGSLRVSWDAVEGPDLAGYRVLWGSGWFYDGAGTGVAASESLAGQTELLIAGNTATKYVRVAAVDTSGNISPLSEFTAGAPLKGDPLPVRLVSSAPTAVINQNVELVASGADTYDFDLNGDGVAEITDNFSGTVALGTNLPQLHRISVWGRSHSGLAVGRAGVSVLIVSGDPDNEVPFAGLQISPLISDEGQEIAFDSTASYDSDGDVALYEFDFNGDQFYEFSSAGPGTAAHTYDSPGLYPVTVRVTDDGGARDTATKVVRINEVFDAAIPWPHRGGNPRRNGRAAHDGPQASDLQWEFPTTSLVRSSPAVGADGTVYFGSDDDYLYAVRPNGSQKWKYKTGGNVSSSPAVGADGTIYVGSWDKQLHAVDPAGAKIWTYATEGTIESSPAIGPDGTLYFGSSDQRVYAVSADGDLQWSFLTGDRVVSSPTLSTEGTVYFGSMDYCLYAVSPAGELVWSFPTDSPVNSSPAVGTDGTIYVGSWDRYLYAVSPAGDLLWSYRTGANVDSSPAIARDGTVYICSRNHKLYAIKPDGTFRWQFVTGDGIASSPAIGNDGTIYIGSADDLVYAINPDGSLKWSYPTGGDVESSPALGADGTLYVGSLDFKLYAIGP